MKTIGLVGGMSWESTTLYYQIINREIGRRLGDLRSAKLLLSSLDFEEVAARQRTGAWDELAAMLADEARRLETAGADCLLIGTNTMHRVADAVQAAVSIPLLHIADVAVAAIRAAGCRSVALLGTRYTMEQPFYVGHLARHGIECVIPDHVGRGEVHRVIFDELCKGDFNADSRKRLNHIIQRQVSGGAEGVVRACTELSLTVSRVDVGVPLFDTTALHALAAVDFALDMHKAVPSQGVSSPSERRRQAWSFAGAKKREETVDERPDRCVASRTARYRAGARRAARARRAAADVRGCRTRVLPPTRRR